MAMTLEQYAEMLDKRDEPRPQGPEPTPFPNAKPHVRPMKGIRGVIWSGYGTLLLLTGQEPQLLNADPIMRSISLEKTIHEFHMWASMSRKPGEPHVYMASMMQQVVDRYFALSVKDAELRIDLVWKGVLDRLFQKEYVYEKATYGEVDDYCQKICYYYLLRSQGVSAYPGELRTLQAICQLGIKQGIHADAQCNAPAQLWRTLVSQGPVRSLDDLFDPALRVWSFQLGIKKAAEQSFKQLVSQLRQANLVPEQVLYIGCDVQKDIAPAKMRGFRTALLIADRSSAKVTPEQLKSPRTRPDILLTEFSQVIKVLS